MRGFLAGSLLILICHGLMVAVPALSATGTEEIKGASDRLKQLMKMGDYEDALPAAETLVRLFREYFGGDDPRTAQALMEYADVCEKLGKTDEGERALLEALRIAEKAFGIRRILRHLPVCVDLSAIHHQSQRRNQEQTHGHYD